MKELFNTLLGRQSLTKAVSKDWIVKFISICLAVILWYYVGGEDRVDKNVMIPIEIINLPRDLVISSQFKKEIEVTVSGPRSLILDLANRAVTRQVDLSDAAAGTMVIENSNKHIPVPRGITVQRVQPASIILSLDKLIHREFPIIARTVGRVPKGYYLESLKTDPDVITITGPRTILEPFDDLPTKAINLQEVKQSAQMQIPLDLDPTVVDLIGETSVTADLVIGIDSITKIIPQIKVHAVIDGFERKVMPEVVKVTANIPKLLLEKEIDPKKLFSVIAMQRGEGGMLKVKVIPRPDDELPIEVLSIIPSSVRLVVDENDESVVPMSVVPLAETDDVVVSDAESIEIDQSLPIPEADKKEN